jgi:predicted nucleic acid-binding protein
VGALILDASVLMGLLDNADAHHDNAVSDVERADQAGRALLAPASAYAEALIAFARADRSDEARDAIASMGITIAPLTATMAERAAALRALYRDMRLPQAIVLACAEELEADLLSYDRRLMQVRTAEAGDDVEGGTGDALSVAPVATPSEPSLPPRWIIEHWALLDQLNSEDS